MNNLDKNLSFLNDKQLKAVKKNNGSLLILAGAGSGKTRVLTHKIYYMLTQKVALPNQILAVTFTNKAANEMRLRISKMIDRPIEGWWIGTFHSLSARIIRRHANQLGLKKNFIIIDKEDQLKLIKKICKESSVNIDEKNSKIYLSQIDRFKNDNITADDVHGEARSKEDKIISQIYSIYEKELRRLNCCDFGNLLMHCLYIFKKNNKILKQYQNQFKYILVDEYQDSNFAQQKWLQFLYGLHKNICCVGDDDQSIYSWRGAEIKNILNFEESFKSSSIIRLEQNYRSTQKILNCASNLIKHNKGRYGKTLWSNNSYGDKIVIKGFWQTKEESYEISHIIEEMMKNKVPLNEIAILFRVAAHTRSFEERFLNIGLPYRIIGGVNFYERKEIKDVIAYLRIANNFSDDLALERIINLPKRGIGQITINKIHLISRKNKASFFDACKLFVNSDSKSKSNHEINNLIHKIHKWNKLIKNINHVELCELILTDSGYIELLKLESEQKDNIETYDRLDNVMEFMNGLKEFNNIDGFLEHVSLISDNEKLAITNKINLMTMHSAKGLEFDCVFLIGWEEGLFPSRRSIEEKGEPGLEEERRLAYVALTRARKNVYISFVNQNRYSYASHDFNKPSRFISELPEEDLEIYNSEVFYQKHDLSDDSQFDEYDDSQLTPGKKRLLHYKNITNQKNWEYSQDVMMDNIKFNEGERVFHKKFGYGRILETHGEAALINFENTGTKTIFMRFLSKEV